MQELQVKLHDTVDEVHDLDKMGPDGSAQTTKQRSNICLYRGLIWRQAKTGFDEICSSSSSLSVISISSLVSYSYS